MSHLHARTRFSGVGTISVCPLFNSHHTEVTTVPNCRWCNCPYPHNQFPGFGSYCSRACEEASKQNGKQKCNQFTGGLVNTLQNQVQIAQLHQQQELAAQQNAMIAEQNQRFAQEAMWKQFLFEVNEALDELAEEGDEVSLLAQSEWYRFQFQQQQFSEADFSEIGDKQYLAKTRRRIDDVEKQASEKSHANYEKFKTIYCEYMNDYANRSVFPQADTAEFHTKPLLTTFSRPKPALKAPTDEALRTVVKPSAELLELRKKGELYVWGIVACMACNLCLPGIAFIPAVCIYFFGLRPLKLARLPLEEKYQQDLEKAKLELISKQKAKHKRALDHWERERRNFEARLPEANREIEEQNSTLKQRYDATQSKWLARKRKLFDVINAYINEHPSLQSWFPRPEPIETDQQNSDLRKTFGIGN